MGEIEAEWLEDKQKILDLFNGLMRELANAIVNGTPFMFSGVYYRGEQQQPFGLNYGTMEQIVEMTPLFLRNNAEMIKALGLSNNTVQEVKRPVLKPIVKTVNADISKKDDGGVIIIFKDDLGKTLSFEGPRSHK